jgi:hypothetical protein
MLLLPLLLAASIWAAPPTVPAVPPGGLSLKQAEQKLREAQAQLEAARKGAGGAAAPQQGQLAIDGKPIILQRTNVSVMGAPVASPSPNPTLHPGMITGEKGDPYVEVVNEQARMKEAYSGMNTVNPVSDGFDPSKAEQLPPEVRETVKKLQALMAVPGMQTWLKTLSDPEFQKASEALIKSPRLKLFAGIQAVLVLVMMFFRAWLIGRAESFGGRLLSNLWSGALFWALGFVVVPMSVLGDPYQKFVSGIWKIVQAQLSG